MTTIERPGLTWQRFLRRAAAAPPVVALGMFTNPNACGIARVLGRRGVPVLIMDSSAKGLHVPSRYAVKRLCPDPYHDETGFIKELLRVAASLPQRAVLFPTRDDYLLPLARASRRLADAFVLSMPAPDVATRVNDKWEQIEAARRAGVDVPGSVLVTSTDDASRLASEVRYPALLKPVAPNAGRRHLHAKVVTVARAAALPAACRSASACGDLVLQEHIPGGDEGLEFLGSYLGGASRPLAVFTGRRLRQHPRGFGIARLAESVWLPDVAEAGLRVLRELGYRGVSQVEFRRDPRDGRLKFIEVNARHYLSHVLATACGVDLTLVAYLDALGLPVPPAIRQHEGTRWLHARHDLPDSTHEMARGELSAHEWLASLRDVRLDGMLCLDDPLPGLADLVGATWGALRRRLAT